jgi:mannose-1-phosphate guanylyltransferase
MITPIILAGGIGSRLWPLSRSAYPKQFLNLIDNSSMLQATFSRLEYIDYESSMVICNEEHRFIVAEQLRALDLSSDILLEPIVKNTAPAIALAALHMLTKEEDSILLVLPADHSIPDSQAFKDTINKALPLAYQGKLVTFGVTPTYPETGYGYIKAASNIPSTEGFLVSEFVEKPSLELAQQYIDEGDYYWNSGIFLFSAKRYLEELSKYQTNILTACKKAISTSYQDLDFIRINHKEFNNSPSDSIDYAVMQNTQDAALVPLNTAWSDVGSWNALWEISNKDVNGNVKKGDVLLQECTNSFGYASNKLIVMSGLEDTIVVETKDAVLVINKNNTQDVKQIVNKLKADNRTEVALHREVYRPWGKYDCIDSGYRYQVKRITVKPGEKLSVQLHHHRAEHWIVVSGTAKVQIDDKDFILTENQSTFIPIGSIHALENPGRIPLEMIEVQSGSYLDEDDIVRLSDDYGRT